MLIEIVLESKEPPAGFAFLDGSREAFDGWLGLLRVLSSLLSHPSDQSPWPSVTKGAEMDMTPKEVARAYLDDAFVKHDLSNVDRYVANEDLKTAISRFLAAFPDVEMTVEHLIAEGDIVAVRVSARATHLGPFLEVPATGKSWEATASAWYRIESGKIVDFWINWDWLAILRAIGAVETAAPAAAIHK